MKKLPDFHVLIVAAGEGSRSGQALPKQYSLLGGKPLLRHALECFLNAGSLQSLRVVINRAHQELYETCVEGFHIAPFVYGGSSRKSSVKNGLDALPSLDEKAIILIHDAARPFVHAEDIKSLVVAIEEGALAASLARPVSDTVLYAKEEDSAYWYRETAERNNLWALQTPQAFRLGVIKKAHTQYAQDDHFTDDTGLVRAMGGDVKLVKGSLLNFKITYPEDMALAERIYNRADLMETRTGTGFDVHAFAEAKGNNPAVRLCGVDVPHIRTLEGHSDADVGLHALTDALLGALGEADIGTHFPPSNPQFKGMDSAEFLRYADGILRDKGGILINADITLICEAPKIGPYRTSMVARIADILCVSPDRINIKATTTEGLGFTGRREGIAAQASVNITLPCADRKQAHG
ncbi:MAG: bifunctional 2-C-methyl-D-erythritol 4-phosphate cytidylyltransferase/2-C-methyl-D-erythritol 2,4-cyclodiphosphate synthase [Alphaproteobacteria bacterium]|nr:bifunctional 2-C-methyl-D-erythritol 4-phosphate cytidylyltransferase/2-C-methyl-D-erythritol 2,4-cyclodiphosphate synthase [Alphaproteobacteria bacterium]